MVIYPQQPFLFTELKHQFTGSQRRLGFQRHLLQSLVAPVTEALVARSVFLISGAIVAELVFYVHGLGFTVEAAVKNADDPKKILAASMALIAIGLSFRILHRGSLAMADARRRG